MTDKDRSFVRCRRIYILDKEYIHHFCNAMQQIMNFVIIKENVINKGYFEEFNQTIQKGCRLL